MGVRKESMHHASPTPMFVHLKRIQRRVGYDRLSSIQVMAHCDILSVYTRGATNIR